MNALEKVRSILTEIRGAKSAAKDSEQWALAARLLARMTTDSASVDRLVAARDLEGMDAFVRALEGKAAEQNAAPVPTFTSEELDHALRVFVKRLKVTRLADESRLRGRYTSDGRKSGVAAMLPPDGFPAAIWPALVRARKLKDMGGGFFSEVS